MLSAAKNDEATDRAAVDRCADLLFAEYIRQEGYPAGLHDILLSRGVCLTQLANVHEIMLRHGAVFIATRGIAALKRAIAARGLELAQADFSEPESRVA